VLRDWFRRGKARRLAALDARAPWVREQTLQIVRELTAPLADAGRAHLEWTAPAPDDEGLAGGMVELVPVNAGAAPVQVVPDPALVTLLVGPRGYAHELVVDEDGEWRRELRACVEAIVDGRYRESASPGRISRRVVTMTFELLHGDDIVVKHHDLTELDPGEDEEQLPAERRFESYRS
jgi:hypothetical protein